MEGDVDVRIEHSTINYKDGLAITGHSIAGMTVLTRS
jgi:NADPH:quinone reductase-like Zn-dependent oxidoreductase